MKTFCFLLLIFVGRSYASSVVASSDDKIIGGIDAPTRIRHQVSLQDSAFNHICGGSLVNQNWVVTAAHCVRANPTIVGYASNDLTTLRKCTLLTNMRFVHNSNTGNPFYNYDIGLLKSSCVISANTLVGYISFPVVDIPAGSPLIVTGWGLTTYPGSVPNRLQQLTTRTITAADCQTRIGIAIPNSVMCTLTRANEGICFGDSGSGAVNSVSIAAPALYGIASGVIPCARGYPDLFVRVIDPTIITWVLNTIIAN